MTFPTATESFPIPSQILILAMIVATFVLLYYLIRPWWRQPRRFRLGTRTKILEFLSVSQRPFIPSREVVLFNLLHLVSRDVFLVFAKIPIQTLVQVSVKNTEARPEVIKAIRKLTADYVLIHPGTMLPRKIIMVESVEHDKEKSNSLSTLMKVICREAEIDIIWLNAYKKYSINELSEVLGLKEDD